MSAAIAMKTEEVLAKDTVAKKLAKLARIEKRLRIYRFVQEGFIKELRHGLPLVIAGIVGLVVLICGYPIAALGFGVGGIIVGKVLCRKWPMTAEQALDKELGGYEPVSREAFSQMQQTVLSMGRFDVKVITDWLLMERTVLSFVTLVARTGRFASRSLEHTCEEAPVATNSPSDADTSTVRPQQSWTTYLPEHLNGAASDLRTITMIVIRMLSKTAEALARSREQRPNTLHLLADISDCIEHIAQYDLEFGASRPASLARYLLQELDRLVRMLDAFDAQLKSSHLHVPTIEEVQYLHSVLEEKFPIEVETQRREEEGQ